MKTKQRFLRMSWLVAIGLALAVAVPAAMAGEKPAKAKKTKKPTKVAAAAPVVPTVEMEPMIVTGSRVPVKAQKRMVTTSPVSVIDAKAIQTSGAGDLSTLLSKRITSR